MCQDSYGLWIAEIFEVFLLELMSSLVQIVQSFCFMVDNEESIANVEFFIVYIYLVANS